MKDYSRKFSQKITLSIIACIVSSSSIISCVFIGINEKTDQILRIVFPLIFWIGLLIEQVLFWSANALRKKMQNSNIKGTFGIISVFKTKPGIIVDITLLISILTYLVLFFVEIGEEFVQYLLIFLVVLSFRMHCILNGKNFRYKQNLLKRKVDNNV